MPPFFSQLPMGWISDESTRRQKSFLLSLPSSRRRRRAPVSPTTVAMQVDVVLRGSCASSFMPALNSFTGGVVLCRERCGEDGEKNPENQRHKEEATHTCTDRHTDTRYPLRRKKVLKSNTIRVFAQSKTISPCSSE